MRLRRLAPLVLVAALLAGCGSDSDEKKTSEAPKTTKAEGGALAEVLSYYAPESAFVATFRSDPADAQVKQAFALARRFPGVDGLLQQAEKAAEDEDVDLQEDVFPLLGNEVALGGETPAEIDDEEVLLVAQAPDAKAVENLLRKAKTSGAVKTFAGARVMDIDDGDVLATTGPTVLLGDDAVVRRALTRHEAGNGLTVAAFEKATTGFDGSAVRLYGDAARLLQDPSAAQARRVPWVEAMRTYGAGLTVEEDRATLRFRLDTTGRKLTAAQLPGAPGDRAPGLLPGRPLRVGLGDVRQSIDFSLAVAAIVSPGDTAQFQGALGILKTTTGVDLERDVAGALGDATLSTDLRTFVVRAAVAKPEALQDALKRLRPVAAAGLGGAGLGDAEVTQGPDGLYEVRAAGRVIGAYGVVGDAFVAGNASAAELTKAARAKLEQPDGAAGSLAVAMDAELLRSLIGKELAVPDATDPLGDATGWARVEPDALTGEVTARVVGG